MAISDSRSLQKSMTFDNQNLHSKPVEFSRVDLGLLAENTSSRPFDPSVALSVLRANGNISRMDTHFDVSFRVLCREHMIKSTIPWIWLHVIYDRCYSTSHSISADPNSDERPSDWLTLLVTDIRGHLLSRSTSFDLEASKYLPGLVTRFKYRCSKVPTFAYKGDERVAKLAISAIKEWLDYPTAASAEARAMFISRLLAEWGTSSLLLEETWYAFRSIHRLVFNKLSRSEVPREPDLDRLSLHLRSSPLANPESLQRKILDGAARLYNFKDELLIRFYSRSCTSQTSTYCRSLPVSR